MWGTIKELWLSFAPKEKRYLGVGLIVIIIIGFISIVVMPIVMSLPAPFELMNISKAGTVGDAFNGISGPFIALTGAILTFLAFYVQYKANIQQREQFKTELDRQNVEAEAQDLLWKTERFERRFFEPIKLHKANVTEMNIGDRVVGSKCFIPMFYELRYCYKIMEDYFRAC